jgi:hypothetical protein
MAGTFDELKNKECLCLFLDSVGDFKQYLISMLNTIIGLLYTAKALIALIPQDLDDQLKKIELEAELFGIEQSLAVIEAPLRTVSAYFAPWADCPPVAEVSKKVNKFKDDMLKPVEEYRFEIEQLIEALNLEGQKIEEIDRAIELFEAIKEGIELCHEV